jgi:type IV secretion system protein VirB5
LCLSILLVSPVAHAQFAVVDVGAITQLVTQVRTLEEQLATAQAHLAQAQAEYGSMTGARGMERLLAGVQRNYLPANWAQVQSVLQGTAGVYGGLANAITGTIAGNAVLSAQQLAALPPDVRQQIDSTRRLDALLENVTQEALVSTSNRFATLQQLIDAIPAATDQKGALDLQARVSVENAMLQNEQTKLQSLYQLVQAQERAGQQQARERALAGHGAFASRFRPTP